MSTELKDPIAIAKNSFPTATNEQLSVLARIILFKQENRDTSSLLRDPRLKKLDHILLQNFAKTRY
jgi:hypothetical protein